MAPSLRFTRSQKRGARFMQALRESEARNQALLGAIPDVMFRLTREGVYVDFAGDLSRLATPPETLVGSNIHEILPAEVATALMDCAAASLDARELRTVEYSLRTLEDGEEREFEARVVPSGPDEVLTVVRDITERNRLQTELRRTIERVVSAGDVARRRLERNLHDSAQQRLVTVALQLHLVQRKLDLDSSAASELLGQAQAELADALAEIRELVRGLHPPILTEHGLEAALETLIQRAPIPVRIEAMPVERFPPPVEQAAYYIVAEALANISKYARATDVAVRVTREDAFAVIHVADDGIGGADPDAGTGLRGLGDRVEALAGRLEVESPAGAGTRLRAEIPLG